MSWLSTAWQAVTAWFSDDAPDSPCAGCGGASQANPQWQEAAETVFPGQQSYQNCGLQSSRQLIEQGLGASLPATELEFLETAMSECSAARGDPHPDESGGTNATDRQCVLAKNGLPSSVQPATVANVEDALKDRRGVIMSADVGVLWEDQGYPGQTGRHAVVLTHADYDENGQLTAVYVNDTGIDKRYRLSREELQDALDSGSGSLNVTDNPIWPGP